MVEGRITHQEFNEIKLKSADNPHPSQMKPVPLFGTCLDTLKQFFIREVPPKVTDRSRQVSMVLYGFADASKQGFGSIIESPNEVRYRIGTWGSDSEDNSSDWREFTNVVKALEAEGEAGTLRNSTVIIATDNSTVEGVYYKGNSKSKKLYKLVVRLRSFELDQGVKLYVTHVAGERMKSQGTDGLSRSHTKEGVCIGNTMTKYCPWEKSPCDQSPTLHSWIETILPDHVKLTPQGWFTLGHDHNGGYTDQNGFWRLNTHANTFVWDIAPAAGDTAIEELRKARLKRQQSTHLFLIPKLFTHLWQKQLLKCCDIVLKVPAGHSFWSHDQFEPLFLGFCFPYLSCAPWQLRHTPRLFSMERTVCRLLKDHQLVARDILWKFLLEICSWYTMPEGMVWSMLYFRPRGRVPSTTSRPGSSSSRKRRRSKPSGAGLEIQAQTKRRLHESTQWRPLNGAI